MISLPRLYAIVDAQFLAGRGVAVAACAEALRGAGVMLVQYRNKLGSDAEVLRDAAAIVSIFEGSGATLILNDRTGLVLLTGFHGVHLGQGDTAADVARIILGDGRLIGLSTHSEAQVREAEVSRADYVAVGPVFSTATKADAEPPVGLEGVRRARGLTTKPLVAIGGITRENARGVIEAGADSVAVISGLFVEGESLEQTARDFLERLR